MPYNLITETNLIATANSAAWKWASPEPQFGPTATAESESGVSKPYNVSYEVKFVGGTNDGLSRTNARLGDGTERYLKVRVWVDWQGNPKPHKAVELQTLVFKQSLGPQIIGLQIVPGVGVDAATEDLSEGPTLFRAIIAPGDANLVQRVAFKIVAPPGVVSPNLELPDGVLDATVAGATAYTTTWTWDANVVDGSYRVMAVAYSNAPGYEGYPGNTWQRSVAVEKGDPAAPARVDVVPGEHQILLTWTPSVSQDVVAYDIYRATDAAGSGRIKIGVFDGQTGSQMPPAYVDWGEEDRGPVNGGDLPAGTTYWYWVVARDFLDNPVDPWTTPSGSVSNAAPATTLLSLADTLAPLMPVTPAMTASVLNQTISLDWHSSAMDATTPIGPVGGMDDGSKGGYLIFRDGHDREPYAASMLDTNVWSDMSLGWGETHTYQVRAFDGLANISSASASVSATSALAPHYPLTVTTTAACNVTVTNYASKDVLPGCPKALSAGAAYTWSVTPGVYLISARQGSSSPKVRLYSVYTGTEDPVQTGF